LTSLEYGIIGNGQTAALVSRQGSIDWCCFPHFDDSSVFARLLDDDQGGCFALEPVGDYQVEQQYVRNTNVLETRFTSPEASFKIIDFMPRWAKDHCDDYHHPCEIYRLVEVSHGRPEAVIRFEPRFDYARAHTRWGVYDETTIVALGSNSERLFLTTSAPVEPIMRQAPMRLRTGMFMAVSYGVPLHNLTDEAVRHRLDRTVHHWRRWVTHCFLPQEYQEILIRSALTLKLLVCDESGAVLAAPTTSLPEVIGGQRNWDYRYCWLRDSFFIVNALLKLSQFDETLGFINYLRGLVQKSPDYLRPLYTLNGHKVPMEVHLEHLAGYRNSKPVRVGNDATIHYQNDVYGEMMLVLYPLFTDARMVIEDEADLWHVVANLAQVALQKFDEEDNGIWEFRNQPQHFTFSKLMCWVAVDRAAGIAHRLGREEQRATWRNVADRMRNEILLRAWNPEVEAFTQCYGSRYLDASTLLMPIVGFIDATDPRMRSTILRSEKELMVNGFAFRYTNKDDFGYPQNAFAVCTFWLIDALAMLGREERARARAYFDHILQYANHLGLFSEDIDPRTGELTGNFPQGYTHVAIINTAMRLAYPIDACSDIILDNREDKGPRGREGEYDGRGTGDAAQAGRRLQPGALFVQTGR
jgi:GH15 family glucan-1,4-alpha-glucosidase